MESLYIDSFPYLDALVGGWFHQDFDLAGGTLEEVVAAFKKSSPTEDWRGVRRQTSNGFCELEERTRSTPISCAYSSRGWIRSLGPERHEIG